MSTSFGEHDSQMPGKKVNYYEKIRTNSNYVIGTVKS